MRHGERGAGVAVRDWHGIRKGGIGGDGINQEEIAAGKGAGLCCVWWAGEQGERGQTNKRAEWEPVRRWSFGSGVCGCGFRRGIDGAQM